MEIIFLFAFSARSEHTRKLMEEHVQWGPLLQTSKVYWGFTDHYNLWTQIIIKWEYYSKIIMQILLLEEKKKRFVHSVYELFSGIWELSVEEYEHHSL